MSLKDTIINGIAHLSLPASLAKSQPSSFYWLSLLLATAIFFLVLRRLSVCPAMFVFLLPPPAIPTVTPRHPRYPCLQ